MGIIDLLVNISKTSKFWLSRLTQVERSQTRQWFSMDENKPENDHSINSTLYRLKSDQVAYDLWIHGNKSAAARKHGICRDTIDNWLENPHFSALIEQKGTEIEQACLQKILDEKQWTAQAWVLERRCGKKYHAPKTRVELEQIRSLEEIPTEDLIADVYAPTKES